MGKALRGGSKVVLDMWFGREGAREILFIYGGRVGRGRSEWAYNLGWDRAVGSRWK